MYFAPWWGSIHIIREGNEVVMFNLGLHYAKGFGVERDFEKALYWMEQAEEV
jgi:TPR repeat protein